MSLPVKLILHRGPNEAELPRKEIRRFEIEENAVGSYDYFRSKIVALYPDLTDESPFRLMWTDDEGDNVCFSSDEELAQALKFIQTQETKLFRCMIKFPQPQNQPNNQNDQQQNQPQVNQQQQAPVNAYAAMFPGDEHWSKKMEKINEKMQHKMMKNMHKTWKRGRMADTNEMVNHMKQHFAQMGNVTKCTVDNNTGDAEMHVDIPIHHSDGTTTCTSTTVSNGQPQTSTTVTTNGETTNVYPTLSKDGFEDLTDEALDAKLNEAVAKMAELGFTGNWVRELLKNVDGDIAKAVEAMNPQK